MADVSIKISCDGLADLTSQINEATEAVELLIESLRELDRIEVKVKSPSMVEEK